MADPNGRHGPLPPGLLPPPPSVFGGGPGRKGPSGWAQLAILVGVVVLAVAGWSVWSIVNVSSGPAPRPPIAVPRPIETASPAPTRTTSPTTPAPSPPTPTPTGGSATPAPRPTTSASTSATTSPTVPSAPTATASPSGIGRPVGRATQVAPTPSPVSAVGTQPARVRFDVASSAGASTGEVSYGSNSDADVDLRQQPMPFAVEVTVPRGTGYVFVEGSQNGSSGASAKMRCRISVNNVLVGEELSQGSCIVGINVSDVFTP